MTVQIIIAGETSNEALQDLRNLAAALLGTAEAPANVVNIAAQSEKAEAPAKSAAKVEEAEPDVSEQDTAIAAEVEQQKTTKAKKGAADKATGSKKASGPSEKTLRGYIADAASYFLNDPDEAPKLAKMLEDYVADDIESIAAEDLESFSKAIFNIGDDIFEGFPAVPKK